MLAVLGVQLFGDSAPASHVVHQIGASWTEARPEDVAFGAFRDLHAAPSG